MVKRVLMIAYHFPPMRGSSGLQRALRFAQYLPRSGWQPSVLSANARAYPETSQDQMADIAPELTVRRSFALDAARHLSLRGRYPALLALPDRWNSWWCSAVPAGLRLIREQRPDVIWSSYPIATAHLIGLTLHRLSGIPWVADQRDPMSDDAYPPDPRRRRLHRWIEQKIMQYSASLVCTTPGALRAYRHRFPQAAAERFTLIENGYDEDSFRDAEAAAPAAQQNGDGRFRLLHSGVIYPSERDPQALLEALAGLRRDGALGAHDFQLVLRATGHDDYLRALLRQHGLQDLVELAPALPYRAALAEMLAADGLLLLQASNCNDQIPAKLYEYLRAARPLLALTDPAGDSAAKLRQCGIDHIGRLDSSAGCAAALTDFLRACRAGTAAPAQAGTTAAIARQSRQARSIELAALLDRVRHQEQSACVPR